jgi:hypothetical protein
MRRRTTFCVDRRQVLRGAYLPRRQTTPAFSPVSGPCIQDSAAIQRTNQRLREPEGRDGPHPHPLQIVVDYRRYIRLVAKLVSDRPILYGIWIGGRYAIGVHYSTLADSVGVQVQRVGIRACTGGVAITTRGGANPKYGGVGT